MPEVLTIVLKGDGTGLTGTVKTASGEVRSFGASVEKAGDDAQKGFGKASDSAKSVGRAVDDLVKGNVKPAAEEIAKLGARTAAGFGVVGVAVAAAAVVVAAFAVAAVKGYQEQREFNRSILASGNAAGVTAGQMADLRNSIGAVSGEYGKARVAVNELVKSGQVGGAALEAAARSAVNLATLTGDSIESITRKISNNADTPSKLMRELNGEFHFLTTATYEQIRALEKQGRTMEALELGYKTLQKQSDESVAEMARQAGVLERTWLGVKTAVLGVWQAMKDAGRQDAEYQFAQAQKKMADLEAGEKFRLESGGLANNQYAAAALAKGRADVELKRAALMLQQAEAGQEAAKAQRTAEGIAAVDSIQRAMGEGKTKTEQFSDSVTALNKQFTDLQKSNPASELLKGVTFGKDGKISGGAYDQAVASQAEKYRDRGAEGAAKREADAQRKLLEQQATSVARYAAEADRAAAVLEGPLKVAEVEREQRIAELKKQLDAHNLSQGAYNTLADAAYQVEKDRVAELTKQQAATEGLLDTMTGEVHTLGLLGEERERQVRALQNEEDMRRAITEATKAGRHFSEAETAQLIEKARAYAGLSLAAEKYARHLEEWASLATDVVGGVADVFTGLFTRQIKGSKDFFRQLKDVFKQGFGDIVRTVLQQQFVEPFQKAIMGLLSGNGFSVAGMSLGNLGGTTASGTGGGLVNQIVGGVGRLFGYGSTGSTSTGSAWGGFGGQSAASSAWGGFAPNVSGFNGTAPMMGGSSGGGGFNVPSNMKLLTGEFAGGMPYASAALGIGGLYYGATQRGNGGLSSGIAALSYGAAGVAAGGAIAGGLGALGTAAGVGGMGAGAAAGATGAMASLGGAAWIPVVGWILAAAAVIDMVSGGKLFGTKYTLDSSASTLNFDAAGIKGVQEITKVREQSLFRGRKWNTTEQAFDAESQSALDDVFVQMNSAIATAARQVGVEAPGMVSASFRQEFDKKGNLKKEFGTIAGRVYEEAQEVFLQRLAAENLLNVAKQVGNGAEIDTLANNYRDAPESLDMFAQFMAAVQTDVNKSSALWESTGPGMLTSIVETMKRLGTGAETLLQTYQRINASLLEYGNFIGGIDQQLRTAGLSDFQRAALDIEMQYRDQVKTANSLAKALGLSGARSEDLAKIEMLRAQNMASLQKQIEAERNSILNDLTLSQYSPLTDAQKLQEAMSQLQTAVSSGDTRTAASLSQTALGFGRNLYASGNDYNALYGQVTSLIDSMGLPSLDMEDGTSMGDLADEIAALPQAIARELWALLYNPSAPTAPPITAPVTAPGTGTPIADGGGPGGSGMGETNALLGQILDLQQRNNAATELALLRQGVALR